MKWRCEKCKQVDALPEEKYCKACKKALIAEMEEAGYLERRPGGHAGWNRPDEAKERTDETKFGTWHG